jgi:hypothetical protein
MRVRTDLDVEEKAIFEVLRALARRARALDAQTHRYQREIAQLVHSLPHKAG